MNRTDWQLHAACRGMDTDIFFCYDEMRSSKVRMQVERRVKEICSDCPVIDQCREWALSRPERHGIWGGLTNIERGFDSRGQRGNRGKVVA